MRQRRPLSWRSGCLYTIYGKQLYPNGALWCCWTGKNQTPVPVGRAASIAPRKQLPRRSSSRSSPIPILLLLLLLSPALLLKPHVGALNTQHAAIEDGNGSSTRSVRAYVSTVRESTSTSVFMADGYCDNDTCNSGIGRYRVGINNDRVHCDAEPMMTPPCGDSNNVRHN
ncbi:uncharacterized protein LOC111273898 [Varroa jacobsoni]|uniref:uncharacterized protein LOC111273898 n=1 Tax=Varroa jacobsoni TaxID=62625 RepID=UPI000BF58B2A|nr:uncharacterized protein LOC111273898 [Varroa jacobsoni]